MHLDLLQRIVAWVIPLIFAITFHELAHGAVANWLGDSTAKMMGRLTLNPIKHIDLVGTIVVPVLLLLVSKGMFTFGWAKPIPVSQSNLKKPRRDMALVAAAGPVSNFIMAVLWALVLKFGPLAVFNASPWAALVIQQIAVAGILVNLVLGVFNFIPIPPLDGSRVVSSFLSYRWEAAYSRLEPFGMWIILLLLITGVLGSVLNPIIYSLLQFIGQWV